MSTTLDQTALNQDLRDYTKRLGIPPFVPELHTFQSVLFSFFPDDINSLNSSQDILEALGIIRIVKMGHSFEPKRISCSIYASLERAELAQFRYLSLPFVILRETLRIDHHWIFVTPKRDLLFCSWGELFYATLRFREAGHPDCWIVDQFVDSSSPRTDKVLSK